MPTISIPEDTFERITRRARQLGTSVEALAVPALERASCEPTNEAIPTQQSELPYDEWKKGFDAMLIRIRSRAERYSYPPGFAVDISREAMYEGCGE